MKYGKTLIKGILVIFFLAAFIPAALASDADYEKGVAYLRAGKVDEALMILEPLAAKDPGNPFIEYHLGLAYYKADRLGQASDAFEKTQALAKDGAQRDFGLSAAFCNVGIGHFRKKEYDRAGKSFERALSLDPEDGDSRYYLGLVRAEQQDYPGALKELERASALKTLDKDRALVQNAVGMVYYKEEKAGRAMEEFNKTLSIDPYNIEALYYIGLLNYKENGYAAAKPYFDRIALMGAPDEKTRASLFTTFFNMGVDFQNRDKASAAAEMFEKASTLRPDDPEAHFYRGYNLMALERYDDAVPEFRQAISLKPDMARARAELEVAGKFASEKAQKAGAESMGKGEWYAALALYERAVKLDPSNADAKRGQRQAAAAVEKDTRDRMSKVRARLGRGEYLDAVEEANELLRLNPSSAEAVALGKQTRDRLAAVVEEYFAKAREAEEREALGEASGYYERLLKADPKNQAASDSLRQVNGRMDSERARADKAIEDGQLISARKSYERLLKYRPEDVDVQGRLKKLNEKIASEFARLLERARDAFDGKDYQRAVSIVGKALELSPQSKEALALNRKIGERVEQQQQQQQLQQQQAATAGAAGADEVRRLYLQGVEYYTNGQLQEALSAWRQVLKIDPGNEKAISSINKAEEKLKQAEKPSQAP